MTIVNLSAEETVLGGFSKIPLGTVTASYWSGNGPFTSVEGSDIRFPSEIRIRIIDGIPESVLDMEPTRGVCCVRWKIKDQYTGRSVTRYTIIPDQDEIDFGDLPVVDPTSFTPIHTQPSLVETIDQRVAEYLAENPGVPQEDTPAGDGGLSGMGSPEGSLSATIGTIYTDMAGTNGAIRWIKTSATGNTGWRVLWGDTGERDITNLLPEEVRVNPLAKLTVHRVGHLVTLRIVSLTMASESRNLALDNTYGFAPSHNVNLPQFDTINGGSFAVGYSWRIRGIWGGSFNSTLGIQWYYPQTTPTSAYVTYPVDPRAIWPNSLPGIPA